MKRTIGILVLVALLSLGLISAHGFRREYSFTSYHEQIEEIIEDGTYEDLVEFREEIDLNIKDWIQDEEDFELAHELHERMEESHEKGYRVGGGFDCPMHS